MFLHTETCQRVLIAVAGTLTLCPTVCFADLPWVQVSEVSDPAHGSIPEGMDIRIARIEQIGDLLRFSIEASGDIQLSYPSETTFGVFMWHIDADNDPNTGFGRPAGEVGADFTIRIDLNGEFSTGRVDKTGSLPSGSTNRWPGTGHLWIDQNVISISVPLVQISSPQQFNWSAETAERSDAGFDVQNPYTASTNALILADPPPKPTVELIPPYFMLSPAGPNTGQLQVVIRDENGIELDSSGIDLLFSIDSTAEFAEVDKVTGLVTAHSPPEEFGPQPHVRVLADGVPGANASILRITETDLDLGHTYYSGVRVSYYLPSTLPGFNLDGFMVSNQVIKATDYAYMAQQYAHGFKPFDGARNYIVVDIGNDTTVPCGLAGNPLRTGWKLRPDSSTEFSCFKSSSDTLDWRVILHEMGHNFNFTVGFEEFATGSSWLAFGEVHATLATDWTIWSLSSCPTTLQAHVLQSLNEEWEAQRVEFFGHLEDYRVNGANHEEFSGWELNGMYFELFDSYGPKIWFDLLSVFQPPAEPLPCTIDTKELQATFLTAIASASTGEDLRDAFRTDYGFPIDDAAWPGLLNCAEAKVATRTFSMVEACNLDPDIIFRAGFEGL